MADMEKVIKGLDRCLICSTSPIAPADAQKAYLDCEYTIGLYCRRDKLLRDAIELLKEQQERIETLESLRRIEQEGR